LQSLPERSQLREGVASGSAAQAAAVSHGEPIRVSSLAAIQSASLNPVACRVRRRVAGEINMEPELITVLSRSG